MNCQTQYLNNCQCNGNIHKNCLQIWVEKNNKCPICRIPVVKINNKLFKKLAYINPYLARIIFMNKYLIMRMSRFIFTCLFVYLILEFYVNVFTNLVFDFVVNKNYDYDNFLKNHDNLYIFFDKYNRNVIIYDVINNNENWI